MDQHGDDEADKSLAVAIELADSIVGGLLAELARDERVDIGNGYTRRMTVREYVAKYPERASRLVHTARRKARFKAGVHSRLIAGLRDRVAQLERLVSVHRIGDRTTPIHPIDDASALQQDRRAAYEDTRFDDPLDDTKPGWRLPDGVTRSSQRPTPVK